MAGKARRKPVGTMPGKNGGTLNRGGVFEGTGRPKTVTFAGFVRALHQEPDVHAAIRRAATNETSRGFSPVLKLLAEYDPERPAPPTQPVAAEVVIRVVRDGIAPVAVAAGAALALPPGEPVVVVKRDGA